jgi:hypothetical protein
MKGVGEEGVGSGGCGSGGCWGGGTGWRRGWGIGEGGSRKCEWWGGEEVTVEHTGGYTYGIVPGQGWDRGEIGIITCVYKPFRCCA